MKIKENKVKISLSTFLLLLAIIVIIIMIIFIYKLNNDKNIEIQKSTTLQSQVDDLNNTINNLQGKINTISETINEKTPAQTDSSKNSETTNNTKNGNVTYTMNVKNETFVTITATKNTKTFSKEFEMSAMIANTGTMELPTIGTVALVAESGGEYCGINIYQLVNDEIKLIGTIDCGADMVKEATYTVKTKNETTAIINAKRNTENITNEFEMSAAITNTNVVNILDFGQVVLVSESGGEYYGIQVYRLSQDYTTGKTKEIKNVGSIQYYE